MSLFKAREWWGTVSGFEEFHDLGCLALGNLDNSSNGLGALALLAISQVFTSWVSAMLCVSVVTVCLHLQIRLLLEAFKDLSVSMSPAPLGSLQIM